MQKKINPPGVCCRGVGADTFSSSHWTSEAISHIGAEGAETVGNVYCEEAQVADAVETKGPREQSCLAALRG